MQELQDRINGELHRFEKSLNKEINDTDIEALREMWKAKENGMDAILEKYQTRLSPYDVNKNKITCKVTLYEKGQLKKVKEQRKKAIEKQSKKSSFIKRVKSGEVEKSIRKHIDKKYQGLYVEHSRSAVKSESFYICDKDTDEKILKLSLHNTDFQKWQHDTDFLDLNNFYSTNGLKIKIDRFLSNHKQ